MGAGLLTAAGVFVFSSDAHATTWWWPDNDTAVYDTPAPPPPKRAPRKQPHFDSRQEKLLEQQSAKPRGPLLISVSIDQQKLRIYDANGFFAESPISTGMRGHATPMGVFSVIQKNKWHRSNIYSGAPMPYMQRITWSGIALHAGVVPGYPASHGCIRMPNAFAMKMWGWTRMGARVIITPGDITPTNFSHALLTTKRPPLPEAPIASDPQKPSNSAKSDKAATAEPGSDPAASKTELRSSILHDESRVAVQTADASAASDSAVLSDSAAHAAAPQTTEAKSDSKLEVATASSSETKAEASAPPASDTTDPATTASVATPADPPPGPATTTEKTTSANDKALAVQSVDKVDPGADSTVTGKDQSRATDPVAAASPELPSAKRGGGQVAVFVSAKDQKLYVRQNMTPLFDVPVTITAGERPLGTHVFTAELAKDDSVRWTVVSLPAPRRTEDPSNSRRSKKALAKEVKALPEPEGPAAALDRLTVPPEAMARIAEAISTGSSLIVSDQGITASGETGQGTDFIIRLH